MHPLAIKGGGSFIDRNEAEVKQGCRIKYLIDGREGILDEALHDGDAFVTFDGNIWETVKWSKLVKVAPEET